MIGSTTDRNVIYRLLPGDAVTANQLPGISDACRRHHRPALAHALAQVAEQIPVRGMRPLAERGPECGPQYPGFGDWRYCTSRSVGSRHSSDP